MLIIQFKQKQRQLYAAKDNKKNTPLFWGVFLSAII
tara:strand:- start:188 stop:295 length:108 start_codon:yes stop_codon:yes gene_type:complete